MLPAVCPRDLFTLCMASVTQKIMGIRLSCYAPGVEDSNVVVVSTVVVVGSPVVVVSAVVVGFMVVCSVVVVSSVVVVIPTISYHSLIFS